MTTLQIDEKFEGLFSTLMQAKRTFDLPLQIKYPDLRESRLEVDSRILIFVEKCILEDASVKCTTQTGHKSKRS